LSSELGCRGVRHQTVPGQLLDGSGEAVLTNVVAASQVAQAISSGRPDFRFVVRRWSQTAVYGFRPEQIRGRQRRLGRLPGRSSNAELSTTAPVPGELAPGTARR